MPEEITDKEIAAAYQPLFDLLSKEHKLNLTVSEMDEIMQACSQVNANVTALYEPEPLEPLEQEDQQEGE